MTIYKHKPRIEDGDPRHGSVNAYHNLKCRCDRCRQAQIAYMREKQHYEKYMLDTCECGQPKRIVSKRCQACYKAEVEAPHGTVARYKRRRCRCDECRAASAAAKRSWLNAMTPEQRADHLERNRKRRAAARAASR